MAPAMNAPSPWALMTVPWYTTVSATIDAFQAPPEAVMAPVT